MKTERFLAFRFCQTFEHEICVPYFKFFTSIPIVFISLNNFVSGWKRENCTRSGRSGTKVLQLCSNFFSFFSAFTTFFLNVARSQWSLTR